MLISCSTVTHSHSADSLEHTPSFSLTEGNVNYTLRPAGGHAPTWAGQQQRNTIEQASPNGGLRSGSGPSDGSVRTRDQSAAGWQRGGRVWRVAGRRATLAGVNRPVRAWTLSISCSRKVKLICRVAGMTKGRGGYMGGMHLSPWWRGGGRWQPAGDTRAVYSVGVGVRAGVESVRACCLDLALSVHHSREEETDESMACSKRRKVDAENRCFKEEWTEIFVHSSCKQLQTSVPHMLWKRGSN